jgi:hypothetical protein
MTEARERSAAQVLDSETFERLPTDQELSKAHVHVIDSETFEPLPSSAPTPGPVKRLRDLIQRAFEAEVHYYSHVFGSPREVR